MRCRFCSEQIDEFRAEACNHCGTILGEPYWERCLVDIAVEEEAPPERPLTPTQIIHNAERSNICCESRWDNCICPDPIPADEAYDFKQVSYDATTVCMTCEFLYTPACPRLRELVKEYNDNGRMWFTEEDPVIRPCEDYTPVDITGGA